MADGLNRVMLIGNLGADPELRFTQGGQAVLHMRLATTESFLNKDKVRQERTDWHNIVVWGKRGEGLAKILTKGSSIFIEGSLRTSSYDNKEGQKVYKTEVIAQNVLLTGGRRPGGGEQGGGDDDGGAPRSGGGGGYNRAAPEGGDGYVPRGGGGSGYANSQAGRAPANGGGAKGDGKPAGAVATAAEMDGQYGNPEVKFMPRKWEGESFLGRTYSDCTVEFLVFLAEQLQWMGDNPQAGKEKWAERNHRDAKLARGWAARLRAGWGQGNGSGGQSQPKPAGGGSDDFGEYGGAGNDDDIPF